MCMCVWVCVCVCTCLFYVCLRPINCCQCLDIFLQLKNLEIPIFMIFGGFYSYRKVIKTQRETFTVTLVILIVTKSLQFCLNVVIN